MKTTGICPICNYHCGLGRIGEKKLRQHVLKKQDPFHRLLAQGKRRWPSAPYPILIMELDKQFQELKAQYTWPEQYDDNNEQHEEDEFLK